MINQASNNDAQIFDVLAVGHACYDLIFTVDHHPGSDEKSRANEFISCGGGTAANGAMTAARLGASVAFCGYLGADIYGDQHIEELHAAGVDTSLVVQGAAPTPISSIFVKPDGARSIVNFSGVTDGLTAEQVPFQDLAPRVILLDGHQPALALEIAAWANAHGIPLVLDADTINAGNVKLATRSDYVVATPHFAQGFTGAASIAEALAVLAGQSPNVVITLGDRGLIWQQGEEVGELAAFSVPVVDTTGAGDAFHGAFAAGLAKDLRWETLLRYASAAGALCCTGHGARLAIPTAAEVAAFLQTN
jgi:sulfofructose kinase